MFLLDTNACISLLNGTSRELVHRLEEHRPSRIRLCSVVKAELLFGARKSSRSAENLRLLERFFATFSSLPFDDASAETYGSIRLDLERAGTPIGANDLMIAAIAISSDAVLVTHDVEEFSRVAGLRIEDWQGAG